MQLSQCVWIKEHQNVVLIGPTGVGKTYLACALGHKACREGYAALYFRLPRLLQDLALAKGDGRYTALLKSIAEAIIDTLHRFDIANDKELGYLKKCLINEIEASSNDGDGNLSLDENEPIHE